jgi:flagellar hook-length control protein FliK
MSVQAVASPPQDFFQEAAAVRPDNSGQGDAAINRNSNFDFKNVLTSVKGSKKTAASQAEVKKNLVSGLVLINEPLEEATEPLLDASLSEVPEPGGEAGASRFNPDLILGVQDESKQAEDGAVPVILPETESDEKESADLVVPEEPIETPLPETDAQNAVLAAAGEARKEDAPKEDAPKEAEAAADESPLVVDGRIGEAPTQTSENIEKHARPAQAKSFEIETETATEAETADTAQAEPEEPDAPIIPRQTESRGSDSSENENPQSNEKGGEDSVKTGGEKISRAPGPRPKNEDTGDTAHKAGEVTPRDQKTVATEENHTRPLAANAVNAFAEAGISRGEAAPSVAFAPVTYTLSSGDKFGEGLMRVFELIREDGSSEARIVVEPPALGRVDISLKSSSNGVEAMFKVDNEELKQMVQNQLDTLKASLQAQGIHVSSLTVDIRNNDGDKNRGNAGSHKKGRKNGNDIEEEDDIAQGAKIVRLDLERGLLHWVA